MRHLPPCPASFLPVCDHGAWSRCSGARIFKGPGIQLRARPPDWALCLFPELLTALPASCEGGHVFPQQDFPSKVTESSSVFFPSSSLV